VSFSEAKVTGTIIERMASKNDADVQETRLVRQGTFSRETTQRRVLDLEMLLGMFLIEALRAVCLFVPEWDVSEAKSCVKVTTEYTSVKRVH
jgi:hypothetical protein